MKAVSWAPFSFFFFLFLLLLSYCERNMSTMSGTIGSQEPLFLSKYKEKNRQLKDLTVSKDEKKKKNFELFPDTLMRLFEAIKPSRPL